MKVRTDTPAPGADASGQVDQAEQGAAALSADTLADLDAIARDAAAVEGGAPAPGGAAAPTGFSNAENLQGALSMAKLMIAPMFAWWPEFDRVWSDDQVKQISFAGGAVCDKHGWDFSAAMGNYGPYIALAVATAPPVLATHQAIKLAKAQAAAAERQAREGGQLAAHHVPGGAS
jgi:heme exporter protein D